MAVSKHDKDKNKDNNKKDKDNAQDGFEQT